MPSSLSRKGSWSTVSRKLSGVFSSIKSAFEDVFDDNDDGKHDETSTSDERPSMSIYTDMIKQGWVPLRRIAGGADGVTLLAAPSKLYDSDVYAFYKSPQPCPLPLSHPMSLRSRLVVAKLYPPETPRSKVNAEIFALNELAESLYTPRLLDIDSSVGAKTHGPRWLIMEALCGGDLCDLLHHDMAQRPGEAVTFHIFAQLVRGLHDSMRAGIINCDPVPPNIMLDTRTERTIGMPNVYLIDWTQVVYRSDYNRIEFGEAVRHGLYWIGNHVHMLVHGCAPDAGLSDPFHRRDRHTGRCRCAEAAPRGLNLSVDGAALYDDIMALTCWSGRLDMAKLRNDLVPRAERLALKLRECDPFVRHVQVQELPGNAKFPDDAQARRLMKQAKRNFKL